jgi:hypothetical protein
MQGIGQNKTKNSGMSTYQFNRKKFMSVRLSYYGINKCKITDRSLTISRTSQPMVTKKVKCTLREVAISGDRNVIKKEAEEFLKYKNCKIEIKCMWNVKPKLIPVITGAVGTVSESFRKYLNNITGRHEVK